MQKVLLVCYVTPSIGIGHLSRLLTLANTFKKDNKVISEFLIFGNLIKKDELDNFKIHNVSLNSNFIIAIENLLKSNNFNGVVFDIYPDHHKINFHKFLTQLKQQNISIISIDSLIEYCDILDLIWIPSFNFDVSKYDNCKSLIKSGWDTYLIQKRLQNKKWKNGSKILVLTGGSDIANLGKHFPTQLDKNLKANSELHWVKGPLSKKPDLPKKCRLNWFIHDAPQQLDKLIVQSNYVITVFGVSFFEVLQYGVPTVVFSPYDKKDDKNLEALSKEKVAITAYNLKSAIKELNNLMNNDKIANKLSTNALNKMSIYGTQNLSKEIYSLIKNK